MKKYAERVVKGTIVIFAMLLMSGVIGYIIRLLLATNMSVENYGMFYAVLSFVSFFILIIGLGLHGALTKFVSEFLVKKEHGKIKSTIIVVLLTQFIVSLCVVSFMLIFSGNISMVFFKTMASADILNILLIYLFLSTPFFFLKNYFQGFHDMNMLALISFVYPLITLIGVVASFSYFGVTPVNAAYSYTIGVIVAVIIGLAIFFIKFRYVLKEKLVFDKPLIKNIFLFALPVFIIGVANTAITYVDTLSITYFRSLQEVGYYQAAIPTAFIITYLSSSLTTVLFPAVSDMWIRKRYHYISTSISSIVKFTLILIVPVILVFISFPDIVLTILFGAEYIPASGALQILSIGVLFFSLGMLFTITLQGIGRPDLNAKLIGLAAIVNIILNIVLVPNHGIIGAASSSAIAYFVYILLAHMYLLRELGKKNIVFRLPYATMAKTLCGGGATLVLIFFLKGYLSLSPIAELVIVGIVSLTFYIAWLLLTKCVKSDDIENISNIGVPVPKFVVNIVKKFSR